MSGTRRRSDLALGTEPIGKLLMRLAIPATISMMVNALYNLVDAIFIGQAEGAYAIGALAVSFPIQMILMGVAQLFGLGAASIVSRALGAGEEERADRAAGSAIATAFTLVLFLSITLGFNLDAVLRLFGAGEEILPYGRSYLSIILISAPALAVAMSSNAQLRAEGKVKVAMVTMLVGTGLNLILDPVFIFGLGMGIRGAAIATAISQFASFTFVLWFYLSGRSVLHIRLAHLLPRKKLLGETLVLGMPTFVRQASMSAIAMIINNMLFHYGSELSIAVYGTINRLLMFMMMPLFGIVQAFQPIVGFNYGAHKKDRVEHTVRLTILTMTGLATVSSAVMMLFPGSLLRLFTADAEMLAQGMPALRTVVVMLPMVGVQIAGATYFQAIGKAKPSLLLGLMRQVLVLIPLLLILPLFFGLVGIWLAFPGADLVSTVVTALALVVALRRERSVEPSIDPVVEAV